MRTEINVTVSFGSSSVKGLSGMINFLLRSNISIFFLLKDSLIHAHLLCVHTWPAWLPTPCLVRSIPMTHKASKGHFLQRWRVTQVNDRYVSSCGAQARMCSLQPEQPTKWRGSVTVSFIRLLQDGGRLPEATLSTHGQALLPPTPPAGIPGVRYK